MAQFDAGAFDAMLDEARRFLDSIPGSVYKMGEAMVMFIRERALKGGPWKGAESNIYNKRYARKVGKNPGRVNLFVTGAMLGSLEVRNLSGSVSFDPTGRGSRYRLGTGFGGGRWSSPKNTETVISFRDPVQGYKAAIHEDGAYYRGGAPHPAKARRFMDADEPLLRRSFDVLGNSTYRMQNTRQEINLGRP